MQFKKLFLFFTFTFYIIIYFNYIKVTLSGQLQNGKFICAATWNQLRHIEMEVIWWKLVWFPQAIRKHAFMGWLTLKNRLTTKK